MAAPGAALARENYTLGALPSIKRFVKTCRRDTSENIL